MVYSGGTPSDTIKALFERYLDDILVCMETSASVNGLASEDGFPLVFYTTNTNIINSQYVSSILVEDLCLDNTIVKDGIRYTDYVRTICELIKNDRDDQCIFESINTYIDEGNGVDKLYEMAKQLDVPICKLDAYIEDAKLYYVDMDTEDSSNSW